MRPAISARNLSKKYRIGQFHGLTTFRETIVNALRYPFRKDNSENFIWALRNLNFDVAQGEVIGVVGRNGSGKSTLLKLLSKITYATDGTARVRGRVASLLEVGTGFHSELSGRENIYLNGSIMGMRKKEIDAKIDKIVAFAGVEKFLDTPIKRFSSGMHLRLGFAVAAHLEPDVLLVDEVLAVGDVEFQKRCLKAMDDLHGGGRTVLFVSHNMAAIENHCSRTLWIENGELRRDGNTTDVIKEYMTTFTSAKQASFDFASVSSRRGSGEIQYTAMEILDLNREQKNLIRSGDGLVFRLHYKANTKVTNPHFGIVLSSDLGTKITSLSTWGSGYSIPVIEPGEGYIDLEMEFLNLMPGRFHLTLWLAGVGPSFDRLENCAYFDVEPSDIYGSGRGLERGCLMFLPCRWQMGERSNNLTEH